MPYNVSLTATKKQGGKEMKTFNEILNEYCDIPDVLPFNETVSIFYPALMNAVEEYEAQFQPPPVAGVDWDKISDDELEIRLLHFIGRRNERRHHPIYPSDVTDFIRQRYSKSATKEMTENKPISNHSCSICSKYATTGFERNLCLYYKQYMPIFSTNSCEHFDSQHPMIPPTVDSNPKAFK